MTQSAHIRLIIDTTSPIELADFAGQYISIEEEFENFLKHKHPDQDHKLKFYVNEVTRGSIITDIIAAIASDYALPMMAIQVIDDIMLLEDFAKRWGSRLSSLIQGKLPKDCDLKQLNNFYKTTAVIAKDEKASATLETATFLDGRRKLFSQFTFNNKDAIAAQNNIELFKHNLNVKEDFLIHRRVLMTFTQSSTSNAKILKKSTDKVLIEDIFPMPLSLIYATRMVEQRLKHDIRDSDDNIYKKGYVVDVMVKSQNGKPVAYAVTEIHQVIDID